MNMVTIICSIISTAIIVFFFVQNIILQRKNRRLIDSIFTYFSNEKAVLFEKYKNGMMTIEEYNVELDILNHKLELILDGKN